MSTKTFRVGPGTVTLTAKNGEVVFENVPVPSFEVKIKTQVFKNGLPVSDVAPEYWQLPL